MNRSRYTLRALAALLSYPTPELRAALPEIASALREERSLSRARLAEVEALIRQLGRMDRYEAEARYVDTFDRARATSLHLFEHVHGDSRERGPALVDLGATYARAGLDLAGRELPDYLPAVLEFASTQPDRVAREFLGEIAHILNALFSALGSRRSPYASLAAAVLELAGRRAERVPVAAELPLDEAWAEPPAFDGCSTRGQASPQAAQPIRIVRRNGAAQGANP
jgi:nitrate reductase delta subunit